MWHTVTAMKTSTSRMLAEAQKRNAERVKLYGGGASLADQAALLAQDGETGEVPMVKLGDASVAAPFTSKFPSIKSTVDIIRQGRCTLVSTIQMQQILALNCLIAAYSLSALYLDGVRSGEKQMIASGMLLTVASLAFSYARPVKELSPVRPITSIFHPSICLSNVGQLLIHLNCMVGAINMAKLIEPMKERKIIDFSAAAIKAATEAKEAPQLDEWGDIKRPPFTPTLLNTVVFLIETAQQVSVMAVNYKGRPFMLASTENPAMLYSLLACCAGVFICAFEVVPELNKYLELVSLPSSEFRNSLLRMLGLSVFGSLMWDRVIVAIFSPRLMWVGYVDAYRQLPNFTDIIGNTSIVCMS
jgi:cation-transporting ATPase 13A1